MKRQISDLKNKILKGDFAEIKSWLNKNIHTHGKLYSAHDLVKKVTGEPLNSDYFNKYTLNYEITFFVVILAKLVLNPIEESESKK